MMNAPKRIWVDSCKDADGEPEWDTGAWGHDQQEGDEEYVRADLFAKAVEALRFYSPQTVGGITFVGGDDAGKRAAAVLAELEGKG